MKRWRKTVLPPVVLTQKGVSDLKVIVLVAGRRMVHSRGVGVSSRGESVVGDKAGVHVMQHVGPDFTDS